MNPTVSIELRPFSTDAIALVSEDDQGRQVVEKIPKVPVSELMGKVKRKAGGGAEILPTPLTKEPSEAPLEEPAP